MSDGSNGTDYEELARRAIAQPLVEHIYTADPSAHVFEGRIYVYASHDIATGAPDNDLGDQYDMEDYHILSLDHPGAKAVDHGVSLHVKDVPWAAKQLWAPDAAKKGDTYYLYFPAKRADGIFQIGVATSTSPAGPFVPEPEPIRGSYSIDPAVLEDDDGRYYMVFGGIWGGQLQKYRDNQYDEGHAEPEPHEPALGARIVRLDDGLKEFAEAPRELVILDEHGNPLLSGDHDRRYFEGPWLHKYRGTYYFSYSTGNTHLLCYATASDPYGPYTYRGRFLTPVVGWTTHHSIVEYDGKWYLFYHDSVLSRGVSHLRSVKVTELSYDADGGIVPITPYRT